ncbi:MAG: citrate (Si)-synthase [Candidatus Neomarinimicrobiota bacterium]|nr:citrate (Si)-synthase [Candidatus Neomarinimicrobiota bacterium]MEC9106593.1 citrate (Si)-synthase [Candidatus Neomarinimicrobiota bacterium]MED5266845.1 citrate (Si)-synthase [Candidatus Neomarinimicrobiota bacterium]|tara:strand:- start:3322 stop:4593 length:1272 start_codon:yes stop_codon:yes gene_type:complete
MSILLEKLEQKIPNWREDVRTLISDSGSSVISEVSLKQAYGGMRGVKGLVCDTSSVSEDTGLIIRGIPLLDIIEILPEEVLYLLLTGDLPDKDALSELQSNLQEHAVVPDYIWTILRNMPNDSHPMAMFNTAVLAMEKESVFRSYYDKGMNKNDFWKPTLEDGIRLIAKLPALGAGVYRIRFEKGNLINPDQSLDWGANYAHMLGLDNSDNNLKKLMRLYLMLHCDHEGGNASAFTSLTIGSTLSDLYYAVSGGLNALAGPLHGLANQECLKFVLDIRDEFGGAPSKKEIEELCWDRLKNGRVIPGYGHAVLRCPDPRFTAFMNFGKEHIKNDDVFSIVENLFEVVPKVLLKHGKAKNPWPNVDAASGALLYHYGITEFSYYTVLFSISRAMGIISQIVINRALGIPIMRPKSVTTDWLKENF